MDFSDDKPPNGCSKKIQGQFFFPAIFYLFKVNNRNTEKRCEICLKLTIKTPERLQCFEVLITNFTPFSNSPIADFKQVFVCWVCVFLKYLKECNQGGPQRGTRNDFEEL